MSNFLGEQMKTERECLRCNKITKNKKFCGYSCYYSYRTIPQDLTKVCEICEKPRGNHRRFCSIVCYGKYQSVAQQGENNPSKKPGALEKYKATRSRQRANRSEEEKEKWHNLVVSIYKNMSKEKKLEKANNHSKFMKQWCIDNVEFMKAMRSKIKIIRISGLELMVRKLLDALAIYYIPQYRISFEDGHHTEVDIYIPSLKLCIYVQGTYYHADPRRYDADFYVKKLGKSAHEIWQRDKLIEMNLIAMGYTYLPLWEKEIRQNVKGCVRQISMTIK